MPCNGFGEFNGGSHNSGSCLIINFDKQLHQRSTQFLANLATPDESGSWLLPALNSIEFGGNTMKPSLLKVLTRIVVNRLRSGMTEPIHSVCIANLQSSPDSAVSADVNTLNLLVPEAIIKVSHKLNIRRRCRPS